MAGCLCREELYGFEVWFGPGYGAFWPQLQQGLADLEEYSDSRFGQNWR
ncbi:MAG: hypothetical protein ABSD53_23280 [Terriglobales bacterium]|jgi:hypothetical protein